VSGVIEEVIGTAENVAEALVEDVEHVFRPRPGGKIDAARRNAEREPLADEPVAEQDYLVRGRPVAVDSLAPNTGIAITVTLTANNPVLPLLPRDTTRRGAVVLAVDNPVYIAVDANLAKQAQGSASSTQAFYLPVGVPVPVGNTAELWASATTTASSSRVSVMSDIAGTR
jgi:hypothetical protein